ncbi:MAG: hypothetical protein FD189_328 [Elusimicrobia bacterium]|nr:MAG: hypothetical protein FD154_407 [Elusimicrobiota bacterium]KAF0157807.1 MAG: hypothetical protein FD189_328 [Elusimicrobiota bacterium]
MPKLPIISDERLIKILKSDGFMETRQKGSHLSLHKATPDGIRLVVVPRNRDIPRGTLRDILRKAQMSREKFFELLNK